jgi:hypothetical protein
MAYGDKVDKLIEVYVAKGLNADMAKLVAVDDANKIIGTDIAVHLDVAFDCSLILIHKSAKMRPLVKRLNSKWAPMFTLNMIQSPKRAEFDGYVSRVLADVSSVNAQEVTLQFELEYASINKHFQMSMQTATRDDMVRSETLHNLVTDTVIPLVQFETRLQ